MKLLQNLSLRTKLSLLPLIPLAGLLYYIQLNIRAELKTQERARAVIEDVEQVQAISRVLHEVQVERALTLVFLTRLDPQTKTDVVNQRQMTDEAVSALEKLWKSPQGSFQSYALIDSLPFIRAKVDGFGPFQEVAEVYQIMKTALLEDVSTILRSSQNLLLKNHFEEHLVLLYTKEYMAQMRSELSTAFAAREFSRTAFGNFAASKGKHEANLDKFKRIASPELKDFFRKKYSHPLISQTYRLADSAVTDAALTSSGATYDIWWNVASGTLNALKDIEDFSADIIRTKASEELSATSRTVFKDVTIACFIMITILAVVIFTLRGILSAISSLKNAADSMAKGDVRAVIDVKGTDELAALASSFNEMIIATKEFSDIANAIGKGDYKPVIPIRGPADTLGNALDTMKNNLQKLSHDNEVRTWLLTGNRVLNDAMRGEKDPTALAQDVIIQLVNHLEAQIGAIYVAKNSHLELVGSYAFHQRKSNANRFKIGNGLVGQAALEKKCIIFNNVPDNYIKINSALGNVTPRSIIVFPFLFDGEVKGVVEVGSSKEFSELQMQFLEMVGENIAIAFNASQNRSLLKELLEETQRQAEELESQQEELRQSNEELQEKTKLLENSEAELKAQQEELQQSNEELEEKANLLEEQKEYLEVAKMDIENKARDLEVTSRYKSQFLANMSHELRTPLNSILILSQLLAENKNKILPEREVQFCKSIYNSGTDLLHLINDILDLSKVESGRIELEVAEVPISEMRHSIESMFTEVARNRSIEFQIELNERLSGKTMITDQQRLEQILRNLLSNAFKFTPNHGSVTLKILPAPSDTAFKNSKLYDVSEIVAFSVIDNGIGIKADKLDVIFEAFQQADGSTKRKYGGTGLGLSISRELAMALGGEIEVQSEEGKGSCFTLYLPLEFHSAMASSNDRKVEVKEKSQRARMPLSLERSGSAEREAPQLTNEELNDDRNHLLENDKVMLILEDDPEFSRVLLDFVRERNYKGIVATAGNTGLSYARQYKPDAIILDMKLPVMDGSQVLKHLKNDPELRHIPVQIISGYDHRKETLELGAFDFTPKPISREGLSKVFDKMEGFMQRKLKKLLVVEDDNNQNNAIRELIGNGDVKSFSAFSGKEAYEMMSKTDYDCVILDLGLPDMPGFELLEKIKANPQMNKVPIIVYTGRDLTKEENTRLTKFANTVVLKTVNSHERLLDETMLFLHRVEARLPKEKQNIIRKLHKTDEVLKNRKILVVDDDIRNIYSLTNLLEEEGMDCLTAENGKIALRVLKEHPDIEMVLMDIMMPEMDGYEATRAIRSISQHKKLPVIALTAKAMKGDRERCLSAGMSDYIAKPINIDQLLSLMRIWLYK